jgi:hypothetical protein
MVAKHDFCWSLLPEYATSVEGCFVHVALAKGLCHTHSMGEINEHRGCGDFTPEASRVTPEPGFIALTRRAALIAVLGGAAGSLGLMFRAGRRQNSKILLLLFAIWVLSPFIALVGANMVSKRWPILTRAALYSVMLVLTLGSLAIYGEVAFGYATAKVGFVFLVVPLASWLLIAIVVPIAALISSRVSRRGDCA